MTGSLGKLFNISVFGESHGRGVGVVIDGCPAGLALNQDDIQRELDRRRPGTSVASTSRSEADRAEVFAGVFNGRTTGAPIALWVTNQDVDSSAYERMKDTPRPGHADFTAFVKYGGFSDYRGGGRFSGRITAGFVMGGAVAKKLLATIGIEIIAHTVAIGGVSARALSLKEIKEGAFRSSLGCADSEAEKRMTEVIGKAREAGDSVGGIIEGIALNIPAGVGEPIFDSLEGELAKALFAIPGVKGVEFGAGFGVAGKRGSKNNDPFALKGGRVVTLTNNAGGILGGLSNGMPIVVRVAVKPTPSVSRPQKTVNLKTMEETDLAIQGRHDACIVPRAVVVVEALLAVTLADLSLRAHLLPEVIR
ncbi:MAG: chorismate synthase [Chloroflexota bacterium]